MKKNLKELYAINEWSFTFTETTNAKKKSTQIEAIEKQKDGCDARWSDLKIVVIVWNVMLSIDLIIFK